ncbi:MAG: OmpA family protein [Burkholderiales bacterium]|nr:OmpA family protein [Burkholderiales bacterium]
MTNTKTLVFASIVTALLPSMAIAQDKIQGYLLDTRGAVVKNNYGQCWRTGYWTPAMAIAECDPDLVKKVEAPAPMVAAVPPPPALAPTPAPAPIIEAKKVSFSADALFAFDKSTLKPEGKLELDGLARDLNGVSYDAIHVTGHTDRIGSAKYNQKLSEQRANAVREYLVGKEIPANRISVEGKGELQPTTQPGDCTGPKSKKLIACLQPDRRVDIEVTGTK